MIKPTVGRVVWFHPGQGDVAGDKFPQRYAETAQFNDQPMVAHVVCVWSDRLVNIIVFDHAGVAHPIRSCTLVQEGDIPPKSRYVEWMPYQKGQAAKTEELEKKAAE